MMKFNNYLVSQSDNLPKMFYSFLRCVRSFEALAQGSDFE